jgi:hypothetical protein
MESTDWPGVPDASPPAAGTGWAVDQLGRSYERLRKALLLRLGSCALAPKRGSLSASFLVPLAFGPVLDHGRAADAPAAHVRSRAVEKQTHRAPLAAEGRASDADDRGSLFRDTRRPGAVVPADVLDNRVAGTGPGWPDLQVEQLALDRAEEALGEGVVPALAGAAVGQLDLAVAGQLGERSRGVLPLSEWKITPGAGSRATMASTCRPDRYEFHRIELCQLILLLDSEVISYAHFLRR